MILYSQGLADNILLIYFAYLHYTLIFFWLNSF